MSYIVAQERGVNVFHRWRSVGKHMFADTGNIGPQTASQTGQNLYEKPCRIGVSSGNLAFYVFRRKNLGFRLTPPLWTID